MEVSNFVLDDVMFLESYRYTRQEFGYVYLQKFPSGKLYAGQTINYSTRIKQYKRNKGNNDHHTNALNSYGFDNVTILCQRCPLYLLDTIEIFLIAFYDLTNNKNGYNKTTGGRFGYRVSADTRALLSARQIGEKNHMYGIKGNFMKNWVQHKPEVAFYVTKDFYEFMSGKDEQITRQMYDDWLSLTVLPQGD